jgi:hypothetical protein
VWEFYNPEHTGSNGEYIATIFELVRFEATELEDWASATKP